MTQLSGSLSRTLLFAGITLSFLVGSAAWAADGTAAAQGEEIAWFDLVMGLFGGLALFLYGMERLAQALKSVAGDRMRAVLAALSNRRLVGLITGAVVTAFIQSSSVTTVMLVGFVSANLMSFSQSVAIFLGAGIGTTITAQIIALKVTKYALLLVTLGFGGVFLGKRQQVRDIGYVIMGLGLIFFGMTVMGDAMRPLRTYEPFIELMRTMSNPLLGLLVGTLFTALIQSSAATLGVIIVLAQQGVITLEAGITIALGANIGTTITAGLASIGKPREAIRVAVAHALYKTIGALIFLPFVTPFADLVVAVSPEAPGLTGVDLLAHTVPRQVANAHTLFAIAVAGLFLPFTTPFARFVTRLVPDRPHGVESKIIATKYLNDILLRTPGLALQAVRNELERVGRRVGNMLNDVLDPLLAGPIAKLEEVARRDEEVDALYKRIIEFLGKVSKLELSDRETLELMQLVRVANHMETIGDIIEIDLVAIGRRRAEANLHVSDATREKLATFHAECVRLVRQAGRAVVEADTSLADAVVTDKPAMKALVGEVEKHQVDRLVAAAPQRLVAYSVEMDIVDRLNRIYYHARRIAKNA
ncbi:MAG: Na/Pi cotransporter family protein [Deltaproteobacteria bacterium]|nr:MAG: Na/Pi cotransporter family protein [Deltaproteobacteria bacterium]